MASESPIFCKSTDTKKQILGLCINNNYSIAELSKELCSSIPTVTKLVNELIEEGYLQDLGKSGTSGGRRPSIYGLDPTIGYLVGVDVGIRYTSIIITDFKGKTVSFQENIDFHLENDLQSLERLSEIIKEYIHQSEVDMENVICCGLNIIGRVNSFTGESYTFNFHDERSIKEIMTDYLNLPVFIENDSRAMTYGEYVNGAVTDERNVLFLNVTWGLGMGMILDGKLYYGKSGLSGEIGHFPMLANKEICHCGKVGCLETGASGYAAQKYIVHMLKQGQNSVLSEMVDRGEKIMTEDLIRAVQEEDVLAIEALETVGATLGKAIAGLTNLFNPELVIIGGKLAETGDYLMLPIVSSVNKYSQNIVNKDTTIKFSKLGKKAGVIGACLLSRSKILGLM